MNIDLNHQIHDLLPRGAEGEALKQAIQEHIADLLGQDRRDCADIALAIDSGRGNEKEIAAAILRKD